MIHYKMHYLQWWSWYIDLILLLYCRPAADSHGDGEREETMTLPMYDMRASKFSKKICQGGPQNKSYQIIYRLHLLQTFTDTNSGKITSPAR